MKMKAFVCGIMLALMMLAAPVYADTFTTEDGVLSIEAPSDKWVQTVDSNYWFTISDGRSIITVDHLSNGESLPRIQVANDSYPAVFQAYVSTKNEVFVVKALASSEEDLQSLMTAVGTVKVLKYDTKTAVVAETAQISEFGLRNINETYYVTTDELNVRSGCSTDDSILGTLYYGEEVTVKGAVTRNGQDYGWYQVSFNGVDAYAASGFLSASAPSGEWAPSASSAETPAAGSDTPSTEAEKVQCEFCGEWFYAGNDYRNHVMAAHPDAYKDESNADQERVQCEFCGEWFYAGNDYRNHVMAAHPDAYSDDSNKDQEMVQCEFCGEWFYAGNDYRNHVLAAHPNAYNDGTNSGQERKQCEICGEWFYVGEDYNNHVQTAHSDAYSNNADQEMVQCEYCGEWFYAGNDYRNHVMAAHSDQLGE